MCAKRRKGHKGQLTEAKENLGHQGNLPMHAGGEEGVAAGACRGVVLVRPEQ